jgi:hypothetical protein
VVVVVLLLLTLTLTLLLTPRLGPLARLRSLCTLPHLASCWHCCVLQSMAASTL